MALQFTCRSLAILVLSLVILPLAVDEASARGGGRGGGGGARGGGGGARGGGGFSGGARPAGGYGGGARPAGGYSGGARPAGGYSGARPAGGYSGGGGNRMPSSSINRSPSMSPVGSAPRASQQPARSTTQLPSRGAAQQPGRTQLPAGGYGGAGSLASSSGARNAAIAGGAGLAGGALAGQAFGSGSQRPTAGQMNDFLGLPQGSGVGGAGVGNAGIGREGARSAEPGGQLAASQLPSSGGSRSYTTDRGTTITVGGTGGSTSVGGGTVGGAVGGIKVEGAGGATYGKVGGAVGVAGASGAAVRGGSVSGAQGSRGSIANVSRGYADTAGNRAGGSATVAQSRSGYTAANVRGGVTSGGVTHMGSVSAVRGPGGNVVAAGRGATFANGQFVGGQSWAAVNGAYTRWNNFTPGWAGQYPGAWWPGKWAVASTAWALATWPYASAYCGYSGEPVYYDYGGNIAYDEGLVYADDTVIATAPEYYAQAEQIAESGAETKNEEWMPLGVFAVIAEEGQTQTDKVVQLAINREGIIRGNFQDVLTDTVTPVIGALDKKTQRVSLKIQGNDSLVVETGLYNLTNDEAPVLVHFNRDRREGRIFVRLNNPVTQSQSPTAAPQPTATPQPTPALQPTPAPQPTGASQSPAAPAAGPAK